MSKPPFPARLHVLLAAQAPIGLVIRRGPAKQVATVLWHRTTDEFQLGQWFYGRIYERRCDLSADGQYLIYFAMNGKWQNEAKGAWTAISRTPHLQALALYPKGDCWQGGGLWSSPRRYWLNGGGCYPPLHQTSEVQRDETFQPETYFGGECPSVYYPRLMRDGWMLIEPFYHRCQSETWFEKPINKQWRLQKIAHAGPYTTLGKGCYWDEHALYHPDSGEWCPYPDWEWAEVDGRFLIWTTGGKLFRGQIGRNGLAQTQEIYDFNPLKFKAVQAPY